MTDIAVKRESASGVQRPSADEIGSVALEAHGGAVPGDRIVGSRPEHDRRLSVAVGHAVSEGKHLGVSVANDRQPPEAVAG